MVCMKAVLTWYVNWKLTKTLVYEKYKILMNFRTSGTFNVSTANDLAGGKFKESLTKIDLQQPIPLSTFVFKPGLFTGQ